MGGWDLFMTTTLNEGTKPERRGICFKGNAKRNPYRREVFGGLGSLHPSTKQVLKRMSLSGRGGGGDLAKGTTKRRTTLGGGGNPKAVKDFCN